MIHVSQEKKLSTLSIVTSFFLIYVSTETLLFGTNNSEFVKMIGYGVTASLTLLWLIISLMEKKKFSSKTIAFAFLFSILCMVTSVSNLDFSMKYLYEIMLVILAACVCTNISAERFIDHYRRIMFVLAAFSVVVFVLYELYYPIFNIFPIVTNTSGNEYYFLVLALVQKKIPYVEHRNYGLFREPGVFVLFLILALIFELFYSKKINFIRVLTLIIAMLLTLSTAGYIILFCVLTVFLLRCIAGKKNLKLNLLIFVLMVACLILFLESTDAISVVFNKLFSDNASRASRFDSIFINLKMLADNFYGFITGLGYNFVENNFLTTAVNMGSSATDNTNTIFRLLSTHGVIYTVAYIFCIFSAFLKLAGGKKLLGFSLFAIFTLALFNENFMLNPMIYILIFYSTVLFKSEDKESNACSCN